MVSPTNKDLSETKAEGKLIVVDHPLVQDHLTALRQVSTGIGAFRQHMSAIAYMLFYEAARQLPTRSKQIETPLQSMQARELDAGLVLIAVLRAGLGFLDGILPSIPSARVGYLGLARNPETLKAEVYYENVPEIGSRDQVFILDPMLATGNTVIEAMRHLEGGKQQHVHLLSLLASPEGLAKVQKHYPQLNIVTASIDERLSEKSYILPGLGDAGDRLYGTLGH